MSQSTPDFNTLLGDAQDDGLLSQASTLALQTTDLDDVVHNALGVPAEMVGASEVVLVTILVDDSGSISYAGNEQTVCDGHNLIIGSLRDAGQGDDVLIMTTALNLGVISAYSELDRALELDPTMLGNFLGGTPLYGRSLETLAAVTLKTQEFANNGIPCRSITVIITDGGATDSHLRPKQVADVVKDLMRSEMHIVVGFGVKDGYTDFNQVFNEMGIPNRLILTPSNTKEEIMDAALAVSRFVVQSSRSADAFSKGFGGGFGS